MPTHSLRPIARLLAGALLVLAAAGGLFAHRTQKILLQQNQALRHQIQTNEPLQTEGKPGAQLDAKSDDPSSLLSEPQFQELLRLRAQSARLRRLREEIEQLAAGNAQLRANLLADALDGREHELSRPEIEAYLDANERRGDTLLLAFRLTHDRALWQEALDKAPNDPRVLLAAVTMQEEADQRRPRLETFKQADPGNALANYLSAQDDFESGRTDEALQELAAAAGKTSFQDYSGEALQAAEDLYLALGYPEAAAKAAAWTSRDHATLNTLAGLGRSLREWSDRYRQSGDETSANAMLQFGLQLGQRMADEPVDFKTEDRESLGLMIQRRLLETMDMATPDDDFGRTVQDRLNELARRRGEIMPLRDPAAWEGYLVKHLSEPDVIVYFDRLKAFGEVEARRWAATRQNH